MLYTKFLAFLLLASLAVNSVYTQSESETNAQETSKSEKKDSIPFLETYERSLNGLSGFFSHRNFDIGAQQSKNYRLNLQISTLTNRYLILHIDQFDFTLEDATLCPSYMEINLNTPATSQPRLCEPINKSVQFSTYSNQVNISLVFSFPFNKELQQKTPAYNISFTSEPVCNNVFDKSQMMISFNSTTLPENQTCSNTILAKKDHRIIMYKLNWWPQSSTTTTANNNETILTDQVTFPLGNTLCKESATKFHISQTNPKYTQTDTGVFCKENVYDQTVSDSNELYLKYEKTRVANDTTSLGFDLGLFSYKYLYDDFDKEINVDFASLVPAHVVVNPNISVSFEFRIKLRNESNYLMPTISECDTSVQKSSRVMIKLGSHPADPFKTVCGDQVFTLFKGMSNELSVSFEQVSLWDLRSRGLRFKLKYDALPRVFTRAQGGVFQSFNLKTVFLSRSKDVVDHEWLIDLDSDYHVRLDIEELRNEANLEEFSIYNMNSEYNKNVVDRLFDKEWLSREYKQNRRSYLISSNRVRIVFAYNKDTRSTAQSEYPYLRCAYRGERRVVRVERGEVGELRMVKSLVTDAKLEWLLVAREPDQQLVVKIKEFESKSTGQLIFSLLGNGYTSGGIYHFKLNKQTLQQSSSSSAKDSEMTSKEKQLSRDTDIIVSRGNSLRIQFEQGTYEDTFTLVYASSAKILDSAPSGIVSSYFNELTQPMVLVPKLTDQTWSVRAPYSKQIKIESRTFDLLYEDPCSKASVSIYEANRTRVATQCGNAQHRVVSQSSEANIQLTTQNMDEVVYVKNGRNNTVQQSSVKTYEGFKYFYSLIEQPGDCYFFSRQNIMCNYTSIIGDSESPKWVIRDESQESRVKMNREYNSMFCDECYLSVSLEKPKQRSAVLASPVIESDKGFLRFLMRVVGESKSVLTVKYVYDVDFEIDGSMLDEINEVSVVLKTIESDRQSGKQSALWQVVEIELGDQLIGDYRLLFVFENEDHQAMLHLDNIELFERNLNRFTINSNMLSSSSPIRQLPKKSSEDNKGYCQKLPTSCSRQSSSRQCQHNSTCVNTGAGFSCICPQGFTGRFCELPLNPCESDLLNKCSPANSKCQFNQEQGSYTCICNTNYFGKYCENRLSPCKQNDNKCNQLNGQGKCIDKATEQEPDKYECSCAPLFVGQDCEQKLKSVQCSAPTNPCTLNDPEAECIELNNNSTSGYLCKCSSGHIGTSCNLLDTCNPMFSPSPCQNNGTCRRREDTFKCVCDETKFVGKFCEIPLICSKCSAEGTLLCNETAAKCECKSMFEGEFCQFKQDECAQKECLNRAECVVAQGQEAKCLCAQGFKGENCDQEETICDTNVCQNNGTCVLFGAENKINYLCKCQEGFTGKSCETIVDTCSSQKNLCQNGGTCINYMGNYTCLCASTHAGRHCERALEENCLNHHCHDSSECVPVGSTYVCKCGHNQFGRFCNETVDKCLNNLCQNGICSPNDNTADQKYTCKCLKGFTGTLCETNVNDCESNPCHNGAKCVDLIDGYKCICTGKFTGRNCESKPNYCSLPEEKCHPDNTYNCIENANGNKCVCLPRFTGKKCESKIGVCEFLNPCRNGVCENLGEDDYKCENCSLGYEGKNCSQMVDFCESSPCQNGGKCSNKDSGYFCMCNEEYTGQNCEEKIHYECLNNKCQHNSKCIPSKSGSSGYRCQCLDNYEGHYCEVKIDACKNVQCDYGYCVEGRCECDAKIPFCNKYSQCRSGEVKCANGATCVDVILDASGQGMNATKAICLCPPGLTGPSCNVSIYCSLKQTFPCNKPEQCLTVNRTYQCECKAPFIGHECTKRFEDYIPMYETYLKQEKQVRIKENCRFGSSRESVMFIVLVFVFLGIFSFIALIIAHLLTKSFEKRYEKRERADKSLFGTLPSSKKTLKLNNKLLDLYAKQTMCTPKMSSSQERVLNETNSFSIPRPAVRLANLNSTEI